MGIHVCVPVPVHGHRRRKARPCSPCHHAETFLPCLVQVLCRPHILDLVIELMVVGEGNELYILDIDQLGFRAGETVFFGEVVEAGKLLQMSVMGYSTGGGLRPVLAPPADEYITFEVRALA